MLLPVPFRDAVKAEKHDALLVGEFWHEARTWLSGDQMDSTLNYTIMLSLEEWMINGSASSHDIIDRFESQRALYRSEDAFAGSDVQFLRSLADENLLEFIRGTYTDAPVLIVLNPGAAPRMRHRRSPIGRNERR